MAIGSCANSSITFYMYSQNRKCVELFKYYIVVFISWAAGEEKIGPIHLIVRLYIDTTSSVHPRGWDFCVLRCLALPTGARALLAAAAERQEFSVPNLLV